MCICGSHRSRVVWIDGRCCICDTFTDFFFLRKNWIIHSGSLICTYSFISAHGGIHFLFCQTRIRSAIGGKVEIFKNFNDESFDLNTPSVPNDWFSILNLWSNENRIRPPASNQQQTIQQLAGPGDRLLCAEKWKKIIEKLTVTKWLDYDSVVSNTNPIRQSILRPNVFGLQISEWTEVKMKRKAINLLWLFSICSYWGAAYVSENRIPYQCMVYGMPFFCVSLLLCCRCCSSMHCQCANAFPISECICQSNCAVVAMVLYAVNF